MNNLKNYIPFLIVVPFLLNFILNFNSLSHIYIKTLLISLLCFLFLYVVGYEINKLFKFNSVALSIAVYLVSFFAINFLILPIDKEYFSFKDIFIYSNTLLLVFYIYKKRNFKKPFLIIISLLVIRLVTSNYSFFDFNYIQYSSDVMKFWQPMTEKIYNKDLYFAYRLNIFEGYSLMINHIFATLNLLFIGKQFFNFSLVIPNIFLFLNLLLISELKINKNIKISILLIYISILLNSDWTSYIFFNSLMGEVIVNFLFSTFAYNVFINSDVMKKRVLLINIGFLYFLKPFASVLFLLLAISLYLKYKKLLYIGYPLIGFLLSNLYINFVIFNKQASNDSGIENVYLEIFLQNGEKFFDFNFFKVVSVFSDSLLLDRVMTLFIFIFIVIKLINMKSKKNLNLLTLLLVINLILVLYLYSTVWKNIEVGSAYRYVYSFVNLFFIDFAHTLDDFYKKVKNKKIISNLKAD